MNCGNKTSNYVLYKIGLGNADNSEHLLGNTEYRIAYSITEIRRQIINNYCSRPSNPFETDQAVK